MKFIFRKKCLFAQHQPAERHSELVSGCSMPGSAQIRFVPVIPGDLTSSPSPLCLRYTARNVGTLHCAKLETLCAGGDEICDKIDDDTIQT